MIGGGAILLSRTEVIFKNIFLFMVLCALNPLCIEPTRNNMCNITSIHNGEYAGNNYCSMVDGGHLSVGSGISLRGV